MTRSIAMEFDLRRHLQVQNLAGTLQAGDTFQIFFTGRLIRKLCRYQRLAPAPAWLTVSIRARAY